MVGVSTGRTVPLKFRYHMVISSPEILWLGIPNFRCDKQNGWCDEATDVTEDLGTSGGEVPVSAEGQMGDAHNSNKRRI
jgi:hypothetical protein